MKGFLIIMPRIHVTSSFSEGAVAPAAKYQLTLTKVIEKIKTATKFEPKPVLYFVFTVQRYFNGKAKAWKELPENHEYEIVKETNNNYGNQKGRLTVFLNELIGEDLAGVWASRVGDTDNLLGMSIVADVVNEVGSDNVKRAVIINAKAETSWVGEFQKRAMKKDPAYCVVETSGDNGGYSSQYREPVDPNEDVFETDKNNTAGYTTETLPEPPLATAKTGKAKTNLEKANERFTAKAIAEPVGAETAEEETDPFADEE